MWLQEALPASRLDSSCGCFEEEGTGFGSKRKDGYAARAACGEDRPLCAAAASVFYLGRAVFIQFFTEDPEVMKYAFQRMQYVCLPELLTGTYEISGRCLRGMGHSLLPAVFTVLGSCLFRLVWIATVFRHWRSYVTLDIVYPVSWIITGTAVITAYLILRKREFAKLETAEEG